MRINTDLFLLYVKDSSFPGYSLSKCIGSSKSSSLVCVTD